jgi:cobalamin biosynthesis Co2+ chelatase CbiK
MATQCTSTASSITEVLLAGDAVLNLTEQPLNTIGGTLFLSATDDSLSLSHGSCSVRWKHSYKSELPPLVSGEVLRLVVVSAENCPDADSVVRELESRKIHHLHCMLMDSCGDDAFMDEEDTDAVTERLRQLGYI